LDGQVVRQDSEISELLDQFECVRIVRMNGIDLNQFQFDYDQTWAVMFFRHDGMILARYGTRGDRDGMKFNSLEGFSSTINNVLEVDRNWQPTQQQEYASKVGPKSQYGVPDKIPSSTISNILNRAREGKQSCIHCHNVYDAKRDVAISQKSYDPAKRFKYPLPQNIGLDIEVTSGMKISSVIPNSAAAKAGLKSGQRIVRMNGQPIHSMADMQFVLHHAGENAEIDVEAKDESNTCVTATILLQPGWRQSDISWRASMYGMPPKPGLHVEATANAEKQKLGIAEGKAALTIKGIYGSEVREAGLKKDDVIVQFGDEMNHHTAGEFHAHLRMNYYRPNAKLVLKLIRDGRPIEKTVTFANK